MTTTDIINTVFPTLLVAGTIIIGISHIDDQIERINKRLKNIEKELLKRNKED